MVHRLITLREYETLRVSDSMVAAGEKAITYKEAEDLLRFDESLTIRALEHRYRGVRFLNYCGVIQVGQLTIEVLPKIASTQENGTDLQLDRQLLLRMLAVARDLPLIDAGQANIQLQNHNLLDIVIAYFCEETFRQFHKGIIRRYETVQQTLPLIRGRWLIDADLRLSVGRKDQTHCVFDDFTDDNIHNQAIKATLRLLTKHTAANSQLNQKVSTLVAMLPNVTDRSVTAEVVRDLPRNRLVSRYETVLRLCEWFLAGQSPNVHAGEKHTLGLLFDMNVLFEEFVAKVLRSALPDGFKLRTQGPRAYLARDTKNGDDRFQMRPDLCIVCADGSVAAIIDTKWKLLDAQDPLNKYGVKQGDVYQLKTYADAYRCDKVAMWYPASSRAAENTLTVFDFLKAGGDTIGKSLSISTVDLQVVANSTQAWKYRIREQVGYLLAMLLEYQPAKQSAAA